jgi:hypothetical protein
MHAIYNSFLVHSVEVLIEDLVHSEHVDTVLLENSAHSIVAADLAFIVGILEISLFDVIPNLLDGLGARQLR